MIPLAANGSRNNSNICSRTADILNLPKSLEQTHVNTKTSVQKSGECMPCLVQSQRSQRLPVELNQITRRNLPRCTQSHVASTTHAKSRISSLRRIASARQVAPTQFSARCCSFSAVSAPI